MPFKSMLSSVISNESTIIGNGIKPLNLALQAQVNQRGHIKVDGSLAWAPLATDLALNLLVNLRLQRQIERLNAVQVDAIQRDIQ